MADIVDAATRSRMMAGIRGRDTKLEVALRSVCHRAGYRFRKNVAGLPGKPDILFPKRQAVILVQGCFFHGHTCPLFRLPGTRTEFWRNKISGNQKRDRVVERALAALGFRVLTVWECAFRLRTARLNRDEATARILAWVATGSSDAVLDRSGFRLRKRSRPTQSSPASRNEKCLRPSGSVSGRPMRT